MWMASLLLTPWECFLQISPGMRTIKTCAACSHYAPSFYDSSSLNKFCGFYFTYKIIDIWLPFMALLSLLFITMKGWAKTQWPSRSSRLSWITSYDSILLSVPILRGKQDFIPAQFSLKHPFTTTASVFHGINMQVMGRDGGMLIMEGPIRISWKDTMEMSPSSSLMLDRHCHSLFLNIQASKPPPNRRTSFSTHSHQHFFLLCVRHI